MPTQGCVLAAEEPRGGGTQQAQSEAQRWSQMHERLTLPGKDDGMTLNFYKNQSEFKSRVPDVREHVEIPSVGSGAGREAPDFSCAASCLDGLA